MKATAKNTSMKFSILIGIANISLYLSITIPVILSINYICLNGKISSKVRKSDMRKIV